MSPAPQTSYTERHGFAYEGMVADMVTGNTITRSCETVAGIGFGKAVSQGAADRGAILGGTIAQFLGITIRDITLIHPTNGIGTVDKYSRYENMGIRSLGQIWCVAGANLVAGDPVHFAPASGALSNAGGAGVAGTPVFAGTGNGVLTMDATAPIGAGVVPGSYRAVAIQKVTNGGVFMVFNPAGEEVGTVTVGSTYNGPLKFVIADGSTDFEVNDMFTIPVTMAQIGPVPGARWVDTALAGGLARVQLGIEK